MLSSFKIRNFKSILEETISLEYKEGKAPNGYRESEIIPFIEAKKERLVPCLMFLGPNASGKSNLIEAFFVFQQIILKGIKNLFAPNKLNYKFSSSLFAIEFFIAKDKYNYILEYNQDQIIKENLSRNESTFYEIADNKNNFEKIEGKGYTKVDFQNLLDVECSAIKDNNRLQQCTFLSKVCAKYPGLNDSLAEAFDFLKSKVEICPHNIIPHSLALDNLAKENPDTAVPEVFHRITELIKKLDIDIEEFAIHRKITEFSRTEDNQNVQIPASSLVKVDKDKVTIKTDNITTKHKNINNQLVDFQFSEESSGTQILFGLIAKCLTTLDKGSVLIIDELDRSLHPVLFKELVRLFKDKRYNKNCAQLIFTTHTTDILDYEIIRVSEVGIVTKTLANGTTLTRLCDFEGLRNVNNFRKQYLEGRFLGLPHSYV